MKKFILLLPLLLFKVYGTESAMNSAMNNKELKNAGVSAALNTGIALLKGESVDDAIKTGALATVSQQLKKFIVDYQNTLKNKSNAANLKELQDTAALIHAALLAIKDQYNIPSETLRIVSFEGFSIFL